MHFEIVFAGVTFAGLIAVGLGLVYLKRQTRRNRDHFDERLRNLHREVTEGDRTTYAMAIKKIGVALDAITVSSVLVALTLAATEKEAAKAAKVKNPSCKKRK
jgi:hypothetical protein